MGGFRPASVDIEPVLISTDTNAKYLSRYRSISYQYRYRLIPKLSYQIGIGQYQCQVIGSDQYQILDQYHIRSIPTASYWINIGRFCYWFILDQYRYQSIWDQYCYQLIPMLSYQIRTGINWYWTSIDISQYQCQVFSWVSVSIRPVLVPVDSNAKLSDQYRYRSIAPVRYKISNIWIGASSV